MFLKTINLIKEGGEQEKTNVKTNRLTLAYVLPHIRYHVLGVIQMPFFSGPLAIFDRVCGLVRIKEQEPYVNTHHLKTLYYICQNSLSTLY